MCQIVPGFSLYTTICSENKHRLLGFFIIIALATVTAWVLYTTSHTYSITSIWSDSVVAQIRIASTKMADLCMVRQSFMTVLLPSMTNLVPIVKGISQLCWLVYHIAALKKDSVQLHHS
jgi:hypothetical protein